MDKSIVVVALFFCVVAASPKDIVAKVDTCKTSSDCASHCQCYFYGSSKSGSYGCWNNEQVIGLESNCGCSANSQCSSDYCHGGLCYDCGGEYRYVDETCYTKAKKNEKKCFPHDGIVITEDRQEKKMKDLNVGDKILVGPNTYSTVFQFTHRDEHAVSQFVQLQTDDRNSIQLSEGHFIYSNDKLIPARDVQVGDAIQNEYGKKTRVTEVNIVSNTGLYNPQTMHGDIVVNSIISSTYTEAVAPKIAHSLLAPLRSFYKVFMVLVSSIITEDEN